MPETTTILNRALSAKSFVQNSSNGYWMALAGVNTAWVDDNNPPTPDPSLMTLPELHGLLYVDTCSLVVPREDGGIYTSYGNYDAFAVTSTNEVLVDNKVFSAYSAGSVLPDSLAVGVTYRLLGLVQNVDFRVNVFNVLGEYILASQITSYELLWASSVSATIIPSNQTTVLQLVSTF